jgi:hypothetical protein
MAFESSSPVQNAFLTSAGFTEDPFSSTNAADEPRIHQYFIRPPYFTSVVGDPLQPRSQIILAPRGGGKTAQRIMVERDADERQTHVCITYDHFDRHFPGGWLSTDLNKHLIEISKLVLLYCLIRLEEDNKLASDLSPIERQVIRWQSDNWLNTFSPSEFQTALSALSSWKERAADLFTQYSGQISSFLSAIGQKWGFGAINISLMQDKELRTGSPRFHLGILIGIIRKLQYRSVYILIDRIDETNWTSQNAELSFKLIEPLLTDLQTLETPGIAFKFFLWDQVKDKIVASGVRRDRIRLFELRWKVRDLENMLQNRLRSFSNNKITSFNEICEEGIGFNAHRLVCYLGNGSPRDVIRVCGRIIDEHTRSHAAEKRLSKEVIMRGIRNFCEERSSELFDTHVDSIKKLSKLNFTISFVGSDVFRITQQAARQKIKQWENCGAVEKIDEIENPGSRPLFLYGIRDVRLAISCLSREEIEIILGNFVFPCPECGQLAISEREEIICNCGWRHRLAGSRTVWADVT